MVAGNNSARGDAPQGEQSNMSNDTDPLQLEHMIGYGGEYRKSLQAMPHDNQTFIKR
jgi:hypothetical protein